MMHFIRKFADQKIVAVLAAVVVMTGIVERARSEEPTPPSSAGSSIAAVDVYPAKFSLNGKRAQQQLVITGTFSNNLQRDITTQATVSVSDSKIARVENGIVYPLANGKCQVLVSVGDIKAEAKLTVAGIDQPSPVSFKNETLAALTKAGCNMGACHGSPSGKAGFRLSLRGYDPPLDILTLRSEAFGRRTNVMRPSASLLLTKPLMEVAHGGGKRLTKGGPAYQVLHNWIGEGLKIDTADVPSLDRIEVFPSSRVLRDSSDQQQLNVTGYFSDGTSRDLTALTVFSSSNDQVASVSATGLVEKTGRGETAILARYLDRMSTSDITFLEDVQDFAWTNPPENNFIDRLVFQKQRTLGILPSDLCTDEEFLRRAYLDVAGRLPSIEETQSFLDDNQPGRRSRLVDQLLDSADFASHWTLKWGDILRSNSKKIQTTGVFKFRRWIYDSILNDKPVDQFARELLTASGSVFENPPANYWRASRDPSDATETTAQLFLGIRIQCAKCHNHPFEKWTQDNYYGIAAAFTRVGRKPGRLKDDEVIFAADSGEVKQPRTGQTMKVHLLLKGDVDVPAEQDRRAVFANWLTAADNPFFPKASVNRIWGHLMGRGIVEPVDDFRDSNPPSNAELLDELSRRFVASGFSRKWAMRTIMNSRVYQLSSRKNDFNTDDEIYNSHANTRLLSAEQLLDAICEVTGVPESFPGLPAGTRATELPDPPKDHYFLKIFGQPQREMACECERSSESNLSQALQMINGPVVHNKLRADNGRIKQMLDQKKTDDDIVSVLYLTALCRAPVPDELTAAKAHIAKTKDRRQALEDVGWALLNSKEFLFQH